MLNVHQQHKNTQEKITFVVFRFNYPVSDFLYHFIYDFERYDEYAAKYVFDKYITQSASD